MASTFVKPKEFSAFGNSKTINGRSRAIISPTDFTKVASVIQGRIIKKIFKKVFPSTEGKTELESQRIFVNAFRELGHSATARYRDVSKFESLNS